MSSVVQLAPRFTAKAAVGIARSLFAVDADAEQLPSERDQNFYLTTRSGDGYVLKIANAAERVEVLEVQNRVMMHIAHKKGLLPPEQVAVPRVCPAINGEPIATLASADGASHYVRLLTYLPGKPLARVKPHDQGLLMSLGSLFGRLDRILEDFDHPAARRDFHWDLQNAAKVVGRYSRHIDGDENRTVVAKFLTRFQRQIEPHLAELRTGVIHNDGNDYNVLVEPHGRWNRRATGVIDFGDMVHSFIVAEVAVACAYAMLDKSDPLAAAAQVTTGYHRVYPLTDRELADLFDLICMRLCMSVCLAANQSRLEPDNAYLRISEKPAWALLNQLSGVHPRFANYVLRRACGRPPVPRAAVVVRWLKARAGGFASIIDENLRSDCPLVFDLSVGSALSVDTGNGADTPAAADHLLRQLQTTGAPVGIGRYDEARLLYTTGQFKVRTDEKVEIRTVHLGVDLYKSTGSPVYAPMDGRVHSFNNNTAHLDYGPTIIIEHQTDEGQRFYTLYGHLSPDSLQQLSVGAKIERGDLLGHIGEPETNGGWPPHLHFQIIIDMLGTAGDFPGVARPAEREIWLSICPDPNLILGIPRHCFFPTGLSQEDILAVRRKILGKNLSISYRQPLKIVRGRGQYLFAEDGQAYLDGVNNVCHVGHCHPHVVAAGQQQMAVLNTNTRYLHDNIIEYAQRLLAKFPEPLRVCFFVCTGSEANELALRLARAYTGRQDVIAIDGAYHGNTQGLIDISAYKHDGPGGCGAPAWVYKVMMPDGYRGVHKGMGPDTGRHYAAYVKDAIGEIRTAGRAPAAFICESLMGCGGQIVLPENYLAEAFTYVRAAGGVCIVDEVQVGFGRVGSHFWAFETQQVVPDIVTLGKPMGDGHPLAAIITTPDIAAAFANGMEYFNTYGGNPVSCAIGMAVLDVIENEHLQQNAHKVGRHLLEGFRGLMDKYPLIGDVRGQGLYAGVELVIDRYTLDPAPEHADYIINRMKDHGILISTDGPLHNVLKLKPPMVFTEENADEVVAALDKIFSEDCLQV